MNQALEWCISSSRFLFCACSAGDLGYKSSDRLFISGCGDDVITLNSVQQLQPADIELSMERHCEYLQPGSTVACSYGASNTELAYIVQLHVCSTHASSHTQEQLRSYANEMAVRMSSKLKVKPTLIAVVQSMPHTIFDKKQRTLCKQQLINNSLPVMFKWTASIEEQSATHASTDPPSTDPSGTDPPTTDPSSTDPSSTDPPSTDPPSTDPSSTDPSSTDPSSTDPSSTDPPSTDPPHPPPVEPKHEQSSPIKKAFIEKSLKEWKGQHNITPIDLVKQFNCELDPDKSDMVLRSPLKLPSKSRSRIGSIEQHFKFEIGVRKASNHQLLPTTTLPVIITTEANQVTVPPLLFDPDTSSLQTKVCRMSQVIPSISTAATCASEPPNLLQVGENLRRKSAPPHEVNIKGKLIEDEARRPSVQNKKVMMFKKQKRNSIQDLTNSISKVLNTKIQPTSNIWAFGCDSQKAIQLSKNLQLDFGFSIDPGLFYVHQTPEDLLENLQRRILMLPQCSDEERSQRISGEWKTQSLDRNILRQRSSSLLSRHRSLPKLSDDGESSTTSTYCSNESSVKIDENNRNDIAIVGMAGCFAGNQHHVVSIQLDYSANVCM